MEGRFHGSDLSTAWLNMLEGNGGKTKVYQVNVFIFQGSIHEVANERKSLSRRYTVDKHNTVRRERGTDIPRREETENRACQKQH